MPSRYERRAAAREASRQTALMGETLAAFHRRETAKPPTLAEIYASHPRVRCDRTPNLFTGETEQERRESIQRSLWEQPRIIREK